MKQYWLQGLTGPEKEQRKEEVLRYSRAFDELKQILETHYRKKECVRDYETPNWEYRQIAVNEYNAALDDMLNLITLTKG
jgi:hypothetical protein